ncbi:MAG: sigma-70 family RNA polymerase sigma factor [Saprospiraceae bacterium]|nr:sigma-70 family RNA polymerase sigma factor [Saprospiraceae bacterium]
MKKYTNKNLIFYFYYGKSITQDVDTISDCIQELFIELWNRKETIASTDNIRSYLVVAFRRKLVKQIANTKVEFEEKHVKDHDESLESTLINAEFNEEQKKLLHQSIDSLTSKQKKLSI